MRHELTVEVDGDALTALNAVRAVSVVTQARVDGVPVDLDAPAPAPIAEAVAEAVAVEEEADLLAEVPFASEAALIAAREAGLTPENFAGVKPSGAEDRYTKADVLGIVDTLRAES